MTTVFLSGDHVRVLTKWEMREFSDIYEACQWADNFGPWRYAFTA